MGRGDVITVTSNPTLPPIRDFVGLCLSQIGKPYIYGYEVNYNDPNPAAFDCSELVEWAGHRLGSGIPDYSGNQLAYCYPIPVDEGIKTYGALLFQGIKGSSHVAVSLGNGKTIEARGSVYGTNVFPASNRPWRDAGIIPDFNYTGSAKEEVKQIEWESIMLETDVVDMVPVLMNRPAFYQLQADGGVRVVDEGGKPLDNVPFVNYHVVANTGQVYYFGPERNQGEGTPFSYRGLPEGKREGVRMFKRIFLG